jgi:hypothetical protein
MLGEIGVILTGLALIGLHHNHMMCYNTSRPHLNVCLSRREKDSRPK